MDKLVELSELVINSLNPRKITEYMQDKLTQSLLVSPWLMKIEPMKIDENGVLWSGNQRCVSLREILTMDEDTIEEFMMQQKVYRDLDESEQKQLQEYWKNWKKNPKVPVRVLEGFSEDEKREVMVKENLHAGEDDAELLRKHFDREAISDFFGGVSWDLYEYGDRINDENLEKNKPNLKTFKCGYVEFFLTDSEYDALENEVVGFKQKHADSAEGFLAYLLGDFDLLKDILDAAQEARERDLNDDNDDIVF